jgi:ectoine hydroxylase-related dioxygenase (phytanoyl-CoA dioxygenase family)
MLTSDQKKKFEENGYIILNNYFSESELSDFYIQYEYLIKTACKKAGLFPSDYDNDMFDKAMSAIEKVTHDIIAEIYDASSMMPAFLRIVSKKETESIINQLLKNPENTPLYCFTNRCRIDPPTDERRTYGWHQEVFYTIPKSTFLQTWCPLIRDTTIENGTIWLCPKSHKNGIADQDWIESEDRALQIIVKDELVKKYTPIQLEMKLGDFLIFDPRLYHKSGINNSNEHRYSLVGMYHSTSNIEFNAPQLIFNYRKESSKQYYDSFSKKNTT